MPQERFGQAMCAAIVSMPQDLKAALRIVDDPDMDDESRVAAAGTLLHILSAQNAIPGMRGILAYVDDALVLRVVIERMTKRSQEALERHRAEAPEVFSAFDEQLKAARAYLGELFVVLERAADGVSKLSHQGHTADECVKDVEASNWLYDAVHAAIVEQLEFDEDEVLRETKTIDRILPHLRTRVTTK